MLSLKISGLTKVYLNGTTALDQVSFSAQPGEGIVLLGANGSGKSTLLRCILGLETATSGDICIGNWQISQLNSQQLRQMRSQLGMVFQKFHLVGSLSAFHNVLHGALGRSTSPRYWFPATAPEIERKRAMECLDRVNLTHFAQQRADTLSGGQQQRVAIARTLMQNPKLILVDEPVASLDPQAGKEVMDLLWSIVREQRLTVICTLHQLALAREYGDRIIGLRDGKIQMDTTVNYLQDRDLTMLYEPEFGVRCSELGIREIST
ncbi:phosphonate ABC transporter ATP-binding protein [Crocosphaera chwakensis]|uniref:Phosphonate ABC transporter PhnC, ATP-binding protein n=1 Tax=Crocosphaera chwakensis CCY0110 TaxID=391612 RepID=A3IUL4_9CHRO|nr:phosphonate ABC transporter ATP-binding protein [Crocosphaera chwakensis]EAZ89806.1 Phosphonate ABC transporter PhnC, ATP-binding protein [Crocosphaera chwakensis CCY0110]